MKTSHFFTTNYLDKAVDSFFNTLENDLADNHPDVRIDNDGVGWTEFWGYRSFDKGTDYPVLENEQDTLEYNLGLSKRALVKLVELLMFDSFDGSLDVFDGPYDDEHYRVYYKVNSYTIKGHTLVAHVEWTDVEDWS